MAKVRTKLKMALNKWEERTGEKAAEAKEIKLNAIYPPIEKIEGPLEKLVNCEKLSLSTNYIPTIGTNLGQLKKLKCLSLGRNIIKNLQVFQQFYI